MPKPENLDRVLLCNPVSLELAVQTRLTSKTVSVDSFWSSYRLIAIEYKVQRKNSYILCSTCAHAGVHVHTWAYLVLLRFVVCIRAHACAIHPVNSESVML